METNRNKRVTAKVIAEMAGVSQSTVSRVMSGKGTELISKKTIERVNAIAKQLKYFPDPISRALLGKQNKLIAVIIRNIRDPFIAEFVAEVETQAKALGYRILLSDAKSDPSEAVEMSFIFNNRYCDGMLVIGDLHEDEKILELLDETNNVVGLCRGQMKGLSFQINCDNENGIRQIIDHLYQLGHRKIAFLDSFWMGDIEERRNSAINIAREYGMPILPEHIQPGENDVAGGYQAMQAILRFPNRPTAVIAADDIMAVGGLKALIDSGIRVPEQISITGFDDIPLASYSIPSLTTVLHPIKEMGKLALSFLIDKKENLQTNNQEKIIRIQPQLIIRHSTRKVNDHSK